MSEDFSAQVAAAAGRLSPQERTVAEFLLDRPHDAVTASTAEIAAATGTSDATVVRTARKLGYSGLRELKRALMAKVTNPRDPAAVLEHRLARADTGLGPVLDQMLTDATTLLAQLPEELDETSWRRAVDLLDTAQTIWVYGIGPAGLIAEYHVLELSRIRRRAHAITQTGLRLADPLLGIGAADVVVIYAPLRHFHEIDVAVAQARRVGASVVLVTQTLGPEMQDRVDVVLNVPQAAATTVSENFVDILLAHALTFELAKRDRVSAVAARQALTQLRTEIVAGTTLDTDE
ncbi:MAG: SIS domain-containing protein [Streptosporangiales bacterium]|nr:SIS domain-containing protein [Streptosporangiales bacterium]